MGLVEKIKKGSKVVVIGCNQFGDTGKGKIVDELVHSWADADIRSTGSGNAGHTIYVEVNGVIRKVVTHQLPVSVVYQDKISIMGRGMAIDPFKLVEEINEIKTSGFTIDNLFISDEAEVITSIQREYDQQANIHIGATGRGNGPAYADKAARSGIKIRDLGNEEVLAKKVHQLVTDYTRRLGGNHSQWQIDNTAQRIMEELKASYEHIKDQIVDTTALAQDILKQHKRIVVEGAQGLFLSINHGQSPFVTSSDSSAYGTIAAAGLGIGQVDRENIWGLVKFPYMTRVGEGPMPSEIGRDDGMRLEELLKHHGISYLSKNGEITYNHKDPHITQLMNSEDPQNLRHGLILAGGEFGATTGRPRRPGWTNLAQARYAAVHNTPNVILMKADIVAGMETFSLYDSSDYVQDPARKPEHISTRHYEGFSENLSTIDRMWDLPKGLREAISHYKQNTGCKIIGVSTGPYKENMIVR